MSAPSRETIARRRAALLVRLGAAGPEGLSVAAIVWDGNDGDRRDAAHLAARSPDLEGDTFAVRKFQAQAETVRTDLRHLAQFGAIEETKARDGSYRGRPAKAFRLAGCR